MEAHCFGCKTKVEFNPSGTKTYTTSRGIKRAVVGICPACGTKLSKMVTKEKQELIESGLRK